MTLFGRPLIKVMYTFANLKNRQCHILILLIVVNASVIIPNRVV
jgi:hypothetical protein